MLVFDVKIAVLEALKPLSARSFTNSGLTIATQGLLATDHGILNHGQVTWTTPELAPPLHTNGRTFQLSTDLTCIAVLHVCPEGEVEGDSKNGFSICSSSKNPVRCINCGGSHSGQCINPSNCTNCKADHLANSPKTAAPTENHASDNTSSVPKSLVKRETRKRVTVDEDEFRLTPKKLTAKPNDKPFLSSPAAILTHLNSSAPSNPPIIISNASQEVEEFEFDTEQAAAAVASRVKIPPFFIQANPDFAHSLAPTLQSKFSGGFLRITVAAVPEWYRYRIVACLVTSSPVPLNTRRVGQRCTLNLSRAETSSRWCGS
ncbi:uncharacterized protein TNCV_4357741 [Trichonephila clavipes]|nr:uncharacterized protein TNCV_4357741 [Trichonephila clavipes]